MMDTVEFLKELQRRSKYNPNYYVEELNITYIEPVSLVAQVEEWTKEHPIKTRQSEFLKMFPNACLSPRGVIAICPYDIDTSFSCTLRENVETHVLQNPCIKCRCDYWLQEVE